MLSGLRNFFLVFVISLVGLGLGAYFLVNYVEELYGGGMAEPGAGNGDAFAEENGEIHEDSEIYRVMALIIGIDNGDSQYHARLELDEDGRIIRPEEDREEDGGRIREADTIILLDINSRERTFMISYLPRDMKVEVKGYAQRLGAVYAEHGTETFIHTVWAWTGLRPDFYWVLNYESIEALFDILGEIEFDVPQNMFHRPRPYDYYELNAQDRASLEPEIDLRRGLQMLNGGQVMQLLRFKGYGGGYVNEETSRANLHRHFIREVIRQKITLENFSIARELYDAVVESIVETNMGLEDFENHVHLLFGIPEFEFLEVEYPGQRRYENGVEFFIPEHSTAVRFIYREYRR